MTSPTPDDLSARKADWRARIRANRKDRSDAERRRLNCALVDAMRDVLQDFPASPAIAAYVPLPTEPGGDGFVQALADASSHLFLPITGPRGTELCWAEYTGPDSLKPGMMGIGEPTGPRYTAAKLVGLDLVFVPALGLSAAGTRLGQGGGYYDRTLSTVRGSKNAPRLVGVVFPDEIFDDVPAAEHDAVLDAAVTAEGYREF